MRKTLGILFLLMWTSLLFAQEVSVTGKVTSEADGNPIPGASIVEKGTTNGTITDSEGNYSLTVPSGSTLSYSFVGMETVERVADQATINVEMGSAMTDLDEVVVVGYGVQKKSVVSAAISSVSSEDLERSKPTRIEDALKGRASGVTVTSESGQPGAASKVRIRGIGTINDSDPLYIVDGMPIDGGIDYLNPSDIESVEVLKDAASGAVYGSRAANGVILVTTKMGEKGGTQVNYDFSMGYQNPWRERDVLNGSEYAMMINEGLERSGREPRYDDPSAFGEGTDWQGEVFNYNAPVVNHQFNISGMNEKVNYYLSAGYREQEGIVGGDYDRSNYERFNLRSNTTYQLFDITDQRDFLNKVEVGLNASYTRTKSKGIEPNSEYGSVLGSAMAFSPLLGVYEEDQEQAAEDYPTAVRDPDNGLIYTIAGGDYNEITNPLAQLELPGERGNSDKFVSNLWAQFNIWENLKFKSSLGTDLSFWGNDGWTPEYYLGQSNKAENSSVWSSMNRSLVWQLENVLTYEKSIGGLHNFQAMLGQSAKKSTGRNIGGSNKYLIEEDPDKANINFATGTPSGGDQTVYGGAFVPHTLSSLFGRVSYNFAERYMFQGTIRRDGSSNFGPDNLYAVFPSFSLAWNITNESFMENRPDWLTSTKLRGSWGQNGNESIGAFGYVVLTSSGNNYVFGPGSGTLYNGTKPDGLANPSLRWEESEQTDIGLDLGFLSNALNFSADYFIKNTNGMLMEMPVPSYVGETKPTGNVGEMKNNGFEFELRYRFKVADVNFNLSGNASYLENELIDLGNEDGFSNYDYYQNVGTISRAQNGYPFPFFYGKKTDGIFQNKREVNSYINKEGDLIQPEAVPGDVRFVDVSGDGSIDEDDRTMIGKGMPDWTYGFNLGMDWKGLDFSMLLQGTLGNDIYDATRRTDINYINLPAYMLDRWTGEGTSNEIPRFSFNDQNENWLSSDLFVKDGSYMRVKNIQLGYTLPRRITNPVNISKLRLYISADNLLTITNYEGYDPEISSGGTSVGIDRGVYPQARVYNVGLNLSF